MKTFKLSLFAVFALLFAALPSFGQTALTSTTLSSSINAGQTSFALASVTGISGQGSGITSPVAGGPASGNLTSIYVDRELMAVISVNTTAKTVVVQRGASGTQASLHVSGALVIIGPPGAFQNYNPEGYCSSTNVGSPATSAPAQYTPWINTATSQQFLCSSVSNTWVPGWGNPGVSGTAPALSAAQTGATITPAGPWFNFTGTTALVTITLPATAPNGTAITINFTGSGSGLTWTAAGNISVAGTATTANSSVTFVYSSATSKWIPSRLA